jgi:hypothetical protein
VTTYAFNLHMSEDEWPFVEALLKRVVQVAGDSKGDKATAAFAQKMIDRVWNEGIELASYTVIAGETRGDEDDHWD